jgi:hypothetical protein
MGHYPQGEAFSADHAAVDILVIKKGQSPLTGCVVVDPPGLERIIMGYMEIDAANNSPRSHIDRSEFIHGLYIQYKSKRQYYQPMDKR